MGSRLEILWREVIEHVPLHLRCRGGKEPFVPVKHLPLPPNWRAMRAREVFDLSQPFPVDAEKLPPLQRKLLEHWKRHPVPAEFRFPELYDADEAAHQFYTTGVRAPLPKGWERYGRTADQWEVRGYDAGQPRKLEQLRKQEQAEQEQRQPAAPPLQDLFAMLGGPAVLLEVRPRTKKPVRTGWQKLTVEHMTPEYLAGLNGGCNIGVSLGAASRNLVTLDFDTEERWQQMLALNPCFAGTLLSTGNRGGPGLDRCHLCGRGRGGCGEGNPVLRQARRRNGEGSKRKT